MVDIELTQVRIQPTIDTPFRVVALFVSIILTAIILVNSDSI